MCIDAHACGDQRRSSDVFSMILHIIPLRQGLLRKVELAWKPVRPSFLLVSGINSRRVIGVSTDMPGF